ncbi:hypothetical protein GCM10027418_07200 [Mariniluteicoccus endophyticus]
MSTPADDIKRVYNVIKDNGERWQILYTSHGIRWIPDLTPEAASPGAPTPATTPSPRPAPPIGPPPLQVIQGVLNTASNIGLWYETRQERLIAEAAHEERRVQWLADMLTRWGEIHREGDQLDLRVTEYLARESSGLVNAMSSSKRVAVPQSILFEIASVQDTLRAFRSLMLEQFEELAETEDIDAVVRASLPERKLNLEFIRELASEPTVEWGDRGRKNGDLDPIAALAESTGPASGFLTRLFPSTGLALRVEDESPEQQGFIERLVGVLTQTLPRPRLFESKTTDRFDLHRELVTLPTEVSRVKLLHSAWIATSGVITRALGSEPQVSIDADGMSLALTASPGTLRGQLGSRGSQASITQ